VQGRLSKTVLVTTALLAANLAAGCAVGNLHAYHDVVVPLSHSGTGSIAVATYDQRPYVRSGEKGADFVGVQRAGFGNPFDVRTASGHDLAYDVTLSACRSLEKRGYRPVPVPLDPTDSSEAVLQKLGAARGDHAILLAIHEWRADTYNRTGLDYRLTLKVLDPRFVVLGEARLEGRDVLGGSMWNPPAHAREAVRDAFAAKLQWLLSHPAVAAALGSR